MFPEDFLTAFNAVSLSNREPIDLCHPIALDREFDIKISEFTSYKDFYVQLAEGSYLLHSKHHFIDQDLTKKCCEEGDANARIGAYIAYRAPKRSIYARGKILAISNNGLSLDILGNFHDYHKC